MGYRRSLPSMRTLRELAELDGPYPIRARHVVLAAQRYCYGDGVVTFLEEFPSDELFMDRDEFVARCVALRDYLSLQPPRQHIFIEHFFGRFRSI